MDFPIVSKNNEDLKVFYSNMTTQLNMNGFGQKPALLVLGLDGFHHNLELLQEAMDCQMDSTALIGELIKSLRKREEALMELEYYCLGLLEDHQYGFLPFQFNPLTDYVHFVGKQIYQGLLENEAYCDGELPYELQRVRLNGLYLQRRDLFQREVQQDLDDAELNALRAHEKLHQPLLEIADPAVVARVRAALARGSSDSRIYRTAY